MKFLLRFLMFWQACLSRLRNLWFRALGVHIEGYVWMRKISIPRQWSDIRLEARCGLDDGVVLLCSGVKRSGKIIIGSGTYINRGTFIDAHECVEVGRNCLLGPRCYITDGDHGAVIDGSRSMSSMLVSPVVIEDGVWLGAHVVVLRGVRIGRNAVVGAGAVVTHDVAADSKVAGVPARELGLP